MDTDIRKSLKHAATILNYTVTKGIPIDRVNTHSLRTGGANALSLSGHSDRAIQKMGRWRSQTFKEYIREELAGFSLGMSTKMRIAHTFLFRKHLRRGLHRRHERYNFVNISGGVYTDVTNDIITLPYDNTTNPTV